ncbi:MAG: CheR family methyltransferase [Phycisphaerales bacterium]|nr:CheR family methyltransferase [Phycisphaerales bacterium]
MTESDHDELARIASLSGLESDLLRGPGITRWLDRRARSLGLDERSHRAMLIESEEERRILSEQVAVPESWIGRYPVSFDLLHEKATAAIAGSSVFRVLSLGCAAGQEPFTAAACVLDAGIAPARIEVLAIDRSRSAIEMGSNGDLPSMAVRGDLPEYMRTRLESSGRRWKVDDEIRRLVRFIEADIVSESLPVAAMSCDAVYCRNVLIYLESDARGRLCRRAASYLAEDGVLFSGHADPRQDLLGTLASIDRPGAFAWRRRRESDARPTTVAPEMPVESSVSRRVPPHSAKNPVDPKIASSADRASLEEVTAIQRLADLGRLSEARELAEALLVDHPTNPAVLLILATVDSADGRVGAARDHLRRALYLDPDDLSALFQMVVLCESEGELDAASRFRRRMDRLTMDGGHEE